LTLVAYTADGRAKAKGQTYAPEAVVFSVRANPQSYPAAVWTKRIGWIAPDFDPLASWDSVNSRYTPKRPGYYRITGQLGFDNISGGDLVAVYKNGVQLGNAGGASNGGGLNSAASPITTPIIYCNGTTDYLELWGYQYNAGSTAVNSGAALFTAELVGSSVGVAPEPWHVVGAVGEPAFQNGWTNYGGGYATAGFFKDPHSIVHLRGLVKSGSLTAAIFALPAGYRPAYDALIPVTANGAFGDLVIRAATGAVTHNDGSTVWFSLEGVNFRGEQ
jgi:hypothetical protein